jgi:hypothetical protein
VTHIYTRAWWKPKPGALVTDGRLAHIYLGFGLATGPGLFGYGALVWGATITFPFFLGWELLFPLIDRIWPGHGGRHPFADVVDLVCFVLGWVAGAILVLVALGTRGGVA